MINLQGIVKPTFHAYRFLAALGDEMIHRGSAGVVTRHSDTGKLAAVLFHYPPEMPLSVPASFDTTERAEQTLALGQPEMLVVSWTGLAAHSPVAVETLSCSHGNAHAVWDALGRPTHPTREQTRLLRKGAAATLKEEFAADGNGIFELHREIAPWSLVLIRQI